MPSPRKSARKPASTPERSYTVFVSSTYRDNEERRKVVQDAITMAGMVWHGMEIFPASTEPTVDECLRYAREADVLVGIIAKRYGWIPKKRKKSIGKWTSYIELTLTMKSQPKLMASVINL